MTDGLATGLGFDAHRFASDPRPLYLATLRWDGQGIEGDSDGDVAVHALIDACCSACGLGDIGTVFGVGAGSLGAGMHGDAMLAHVAHLMHDHGYVPCNAAVTVIGNRPKIGTRRALAQESMSSILGCPVSLAATTTDGMGFTGAGEGIAAMATVLVRTPDRR